MYKEVYYELTVLGTFFGVNKESYWGMSWDPLDPADTMFVVSQHQHPSNTNLSGYAGHVTVSTKEE